MTTITTTLSNGSAQMRAPFAQRERGSILLMVLALLSLLLLLALSLTYISRLEIAAATNAAEGVQLRMAPATKMSEILSEMNAQPLATVSASGSSRLGNTAPPDSVWSTTPRAVSAFKKNAKGEVPEELRLSLFAMVRPEFQDWLEESEARDQCALINPNVVRDVDSDAQEPIPGIQRLALFSQNQPVSTSVSATGPQAPIARSISTVDFERFVADRLSEKRVRAANSQSMATALKQGAAVDPSEQRGNRFTDKRYQPVYQKLSKIASEAYDQEKPKNQNNDKTKQNSRVEQNQQRLPFASMSDLRLLPGMTPSAFRVLSPLLTTVSTSPQVWRAADGDAFVRVPINTATPEQIFNALELLYITANKELLRQIAVNIVDRRDEDSIPTQFPGASGISPIIGAELGVFISEVYPDSKSLASQNDNGEYIELHNPLAKSISVSGWRLDWGAGSMVLSGSIAPGGTLILTDDINDLTDPSPNTEGLSMGSFYDIFNVVASGKNRIAEKEGMDIPNDFGTIHLLDNEGNLIDYMLYSGAQFSGINRGFAKMFPFSHEGVGMAASPFAYNLMPPTEAHQRAAWDNWIARMDTPFRSSAEALAVPVLAPPVRTVPVANTYTVDIFPLALISNDDRPDFRLLDIFTAADVEQAFVDEDAPRPWRAETSAEESTHEQQDEQYPFPVAHGRINLNSASAQVLEVLPGVDSQISFAITQYRALLRRQGERQPFNSLADFANCDKVWQDVSAPQRLDALLRICPLATVYSATYYVTATQRLPAATEEGEAPNGGFSSVALVNLVPTGVDVLHWDYLRLAETRSDR